MIFTSCQSRYLCMNARTTLPHFISLTFLPKLPTYTPTTPEVLLVETFHLAKNTLQYGLRSICFNGAKIWNSIPSEIRNASSVRIFKKNLKYLFLDLIFSSIFAGCCIWCGGVYFLTISALGGPGMEFSPPLHFLLGHQESEGRLSFASWCPGGELRVGGWGNAVVGLLGEWMVGLCLRSGCGLSDL